MNQNNNWEEQFDNEIEQAHAARLAKNEGKARVCARRAAGIVVGEYLARHGAPLQNPSSYARLKYLISIPDIPAQIKETASHLIIRVDQNHNLPIDVDLIAEAKILKEALLES
jgi:hypothetical protein